MSHPGKGRNNWIEKDPDFKMVMVPLGRRLRVLFNGVVIADSRDVGLLKEPGHDPVPYFPSADVRMDLLRPGTRTSHCPWKGACRYFTISAGDRIAENAAWAYLEPYPQVPYFRDRIAFYAERMDRWIEGEGEA